MPATTFTISVSKWDTFVKYFLMSHPNQTLSWSAPLSDEDWVKHRILLFARGSYLRGMACEFEQSILPPVDIALIA